MKFYMRDSHPYVFGFVHKAIFDNEGPLYVWNTSVDQESLNPYENPVFFSNPLYFRDKLAAC